MDIGITMFATDYAMRPDDLAAACEERGFESIWFPEHTHIPASRLSPWPGGAELPKGILAHPRPVCGADGGRRRDQEDQDRQRDLSGD